MAHLPARGIGSPRTWRASKPRCRSTSACPSAASSTCSSARAERQPDRTALTMLMTGAPDEQPRRVELRELLGLVRRAANLFASLGGPRPGVAYMLPSLVETHATLWGAETAGYAVPINFLLQPEHIAGLLKASGARILVALGPHPVLDIWQKALVLREQVPGLKLLRVAPPGTPAVDGVLDFHAALMAQPDDRLVFGEPGRDDDVAAYFHTGGTTGAPQAWCAHAPQPAGRGARRRVLGDMRANDTLTATLPLFHVGGTIFCGLSAFMAGIGLLIMSPGGLRNPAMVQGFWRLVAQYARRWSAPCRRRSARCSRCRSTAPTSAPVRAGFCGAASLPPAVGERFRQVDRPRPVRGLRHDRGLGPDRDRPARRRGRRRLGRAGRCPYTARGRRRLDADGGLGATARPDEIGVIAMRGPACLAGYLNPEHDARRLRRGGWLNTGDLGLHRRRRPLDIAGRAKDLIIRSGHNIDPLMIENALRGIRRSRWRPRSAQPDAYAGELPVCYVRCGPAPARREDELHEHMRKRIASGRRGRSRSTSSTRSR